MTPPNPLIGSHEDKELDLMLHHGKPLALISLRPITEFEPHIASGRFLHRRIRNAYRGTHVAFAYSDVIAPPEEAWRMDAAEAIYRDVRAMGVMTVVQHIDLGRLLGYTEEEINAFLDHSAALDHEVRGAASVEENNTKLWPRHHDFRARVE